MSLCRREFLTLAAGACAGMCGLPDVRADGGAVQVVDAGPAGQFAVDGVYDSFRGSGFFVVRRGGKLSAFSSICPHRAVQLKAEPDGSFYCHRHGSTFSPTGHVTKGPAKRDMPLLATSVNGAGHLLVSVPNT